MLEFTLPRRRGGINPAAQIALVLLPQSYSVLSAVVRFVDVTWVFLWKFIYTGSRDAGTCVPGGFLN